MNKKLHLSWLAIGTVASAFWLTGCVAEDVGEEGAATDLAAAAPTTEEMATGDVAVKIAADQAKVGSLDTISVTITLTNTAKHPVRLLNWYAPSEELEEDLFLVQTQGQSVDFIGPHYKRPAPVDSDYVTLAPGKSVTRTVDLTQFYDFSQTGDYTIRYAAEYLSQGKKQPVEIQSNDASMWIQGHFVAQPQKITNGGSSSLAFSKCDATQSNTLTQALAAAQVMADGANNYLLNTTPSGTPRYSKWFGAFSPNSWGTAKSHFVAIKDALDTKPMTFDCGCKKTYYAYVYPNQPYKVFVCKAFWTAPMTGTDSKGGTIIHETSHFTAVAGTDDFAYGQSAASSLASTDPTKALGNADNHEYFSENTPALQ